MSGRVSDDMFKELRVTERNIIEYNKVPLSAITGFLSGWMLSHQEDDSPARMKLSQLVETCESLVSIEEILTVRKRHSFSSRCFPPFNPPLPLDSELI